jgi:hypothetical protein
MLKNNIKLQGLHSGLIDLNCKSWTLQGVCLADSFNGIGWFKNSLEELAFLLGIETNFVDGKDVYSYFLAEKTKELDNSIINEVFTLINCHKIINGEEVCTELNSTITIVEVPVQEVELTLLQKLNSNKNIYASELAEIKTILNKPKLAKKDKEICFELIKASLSDIDKDFGKVKNQTEIDQIINQLKSELENN